jgi:hypothetical protein
MVQKIIDDMKEGLSAIQAVRPTPDGYRIISRRTRDDITRRITEFATLFQNRDSTLFTNLTQLPTKLCLYHVDPYSGVRTGNFVVDRMALNYLIATVDCGSSPIFQGCLKIKPTKVFISHSTEDVEYIKPLVGTLEKLGVQPEQLFCSSFAGYRIPLGENIYDYLYKQFDDYDLYVIFMLSKNYYKSPACLNEMGATWMLKTEYQAILLPSFTFKKVEGAIDPRKISFKLDDTKERASRLIELKNKIVGLLGLAIPDELIWERQKTEFLEAIDMITVAPKTTGKGSITL